MQRRLAAIMAADVAGYSRLMHEDESGTFVALKTRRKQILEPLVAGHRGRIVKLTGDGALIEFASALSAVECAVAVQQQLADANKGLPDERCIDVRIGINLGDVIAESGDLFGDGVNIAARLETLAEPGGICVSKTVHDEVARKLDLEFEELGPQELRNIARRVRAFRIKLAGTPVRARPRQFRPSAKPSIVVLPLTNMSGGAEQEFFADGLSEDIITELSRFHELFVISRNSAFKYKNTAINVQQVARDLGVHYVVEGSVRRSGDRLRVTVQLIDAETDRHIWAERYDRRLEDVFAIQDEISSAIAATLAGRVEAAARDRAARKPTSNMAAYECVLAGKRLHHRSTRTDNAAALRLLDRAIELDPEYAHAHAWRACTLGQSWSCGWSEDRDATWNMVVEALETALALDDNDSDVHRILAACNLVRHDHDRAVYHQERALSLNPNDDLIVVQQGEILTWLGRPEDGIEWIRKAMRLNPYHPERFWNHLGRACFVARRYEEALQAFARITAPDAFHHAFMAAAHARLGHDAEVRRHVQEVLQRQPDFRVESYLESLHYRQDGDIAHHRESLLQAGLPA